MISSSSAARLRGVVGGQLRALPTVAGHVRGLQIDEVRRHLERVVELGPAQGAVRFGLEVEDGVPGVRLGELLEPRLSMLDEEIGEGRVIRAAASLARGVQRPR